MTVDLDGNIFAADGECRIFRISTNGEVIRIAGRLPVGMFRGACGNEGEGGLAVDALISRPHGMAVDIHGRLLFADSLNHCIRRIDIDGTLASVAGTCGAKGFAGDGGPATQARLNTPLGIAVDFAGNMWIADTQNGRLRRVAPDGTIATFAGSGN